MKKFLLFFALCVFANAAMDVVSGVYLPDIYIDGLKKSKSHALSFSKFINATNASRADAISIDNHEIIYVYNYSDAQTKNITRIEMKTITVMNPDGTSYDIKRKLGYIEDGGIGYSMVGHINDVVSVAQHFISKTIFGYKHYKNKNGDEFFLDENGNLHYKNARYEFWFTEQNPYNYDAICSQDKHQLYFFSLKNRKIQIYEGVSQDGEPAHFAQEFILVDELERGFF